MDNGKIEIHRDHPCCAYRADGGRCGSGPAGWWSCRPGAQQACARASSESGLSDRHGRDRPAARRLASGGSDAARPLHRAAGQPYRQQHLHGLLRAGVRPLTEARRAGARGVAGQLCTRLQAVTGHRACPDTGYEADLTRALPGPSRSLLWRPTLLVIARPRSVPPSRTPPSKTTG